MVTLVRHILYDPLPTPAGRSGKLAVLVGFAGWVALSVAAGLWLTGLSLADDPGLTTGLRVAGAWVAGGCLVGFFAGILASASGVTKLMNGVPDPGLKAVVLGFALNGLPMALIAAAGAYDRYGRPGD